LVELHVEQGSKISSGDPIASIEAMKMETVIRSDQAGTIKKIYASIGDTLSPQELMMELE
jgi:biotin carboxyl carrier protein